MCKHINIPKERYIWAIRRAGLYLDDYLEKHPEVKLWMNGEKEPTIKKLEAFSRSVKVPFGFLFLENAPVENVPFPVFRGEAGRYNHFDLNVYDTVNGLKLRQDWLEEYLTENEIDTCQFVNRVTLDTPISESVRILRDALCLKPRWAFSLASTEAAISKLTEMLEFAGVFVAYNGVVANDSHRPIKVSECRGFALVNKVAPYIFINSSDAPVAQLFTLIHETAHLMIGVSAGHAETNTLCDDTIETYCNKVAAEFLVPANELRSVWNADMKSTARKFRVSELVVARKALEIGLIDKESFYAFWTEYVSRPPYMRNKNRKGGDFYRTSVKRVGRLFAIHVKNAVGNRQLSYVDAYRLTGLYGKTYAKFMNTNI